MNNPYPVDIWSVKKLGVEKWLREIDPWPVSSQEYLLICAAVDRIYSQVCKDASPDVADAFISVNKLIIEFSELLHCHIVVARLRQNKNPINYDDQTGRRWYYDGIVKGNSNFEGLFYLKKQSLFPPEFTFSTIFSQQLLSLRRNIRLKMKMSAISAGAFDRADFFSTMALSPELVDYANYQKGKVRYVSPLGLRIPSVLQKNNEVKSLSERIVNGLNELAMSKASPLHYLHKIYLHRLTSDLVSSALAIGEKAQEYFCKKSRREFLANSLGNTYSRILCLAAQRAGHVVVGATHGNYFGMFKSFPSAMVEMTVVNKFVVPSRKSIPLFEATRDMHSISKSKAPQFIPIRNSRASSLSEKTPSLPVTQAIRSVMIIEYPMTPFPHMFEGHFWNFQLHNILSLSPVLRKAGIKGILKRHPDRLEESHNLYESFFDEVVMAPFEQIANTADGFIFTYLTTTTFNFALLTRKPVFIFESSLSYVWEQVHPFLRKRCLVIPSSTNNSGMLTYDSDFLIGNLKQPWHVKDHETNLDFMSD